MTSSKQLIVLTGGGRKGIVKLTAMAGSAKGTCSLDFRPAGATLYLVGDGIAAVPLKDMNTAFDAPFLSSGEASCLVRSSSLTMFGGALPHSEIIKRVDEYLKSATKRAPSPSSGSARDTLNENAKNYPPRNEHPGQNYDSASRDGAESKNDFEKQTSAKDEAPKYDAPNDESSASDERDDGEYEWENTQKAQNDDAQNAFVGRMAYPRDEKSGAEEKGARSALSDLMSERDRFDGNNFYLAVKPQIDEMFVCYPEETLLTTTVERSKWVRVDAPDGEYAVGILYDGDDPAFICYAVPSRTSRRPPAEIENMCVWLPVASREIAGYWVIYQSAKTGEIIK